MVAVDRITGDGEKRLDAKKSVKPRSVALHDQIKMSKQFTARLQSAWRRLDPDGSSV
jgi:hypothetical protein